MRSSVWAVPALLALLVLSACSGGDGAAEPTLPGGRTAAPAAPGDAGPASKLAAKFLAGVDGKYVYRYTGPIGEVKEGVFTVYRLGVNDREDWTTNQFGFDATTVTIIAAENNFLCTIAGATNNCRVAGVSELDALRVFFTPIFDGLSALVTEHDMFEIEKLGPETYAGLSGTCYRAVSKTRIGQGPPSSEEINACYTDGGAVLYFARTTTPDSAAIPATTFAITLEEAGDAQPSDFEPTSPIR